MYLYHPLFYITTGLFLFFTGWWMVDIYSGAIGSGTSIIPSVYAIVALIAALYGTFVIAPQWGGRKSVLGKAILFFSLGLFLQFFGQVAYSFYVYVLHIEIPYPSLGDIGYFGTIPAYCLGVLYIAKASGIKITFQNYTSKIAAFVIPVVMVLFGYMLLLRGYEFDWSTPLRIFLDFGYPLGDAIYISLTLTTMLLTKNVLGGIMRKRILYILFALCLQFFTDYMFLFLVKQGWWNVGGVSDYLYLLTYVAFCYVFSYLSTTAVRLST